ncbi:MAG: hypothetical protein WKF75_15495, partial [Singulisphaera sp.]
MGRDDDEHLGALIGPARRQADEDGGVVAGGPRGRGEGLHAPGADGDLDHQFVLGGPLGGRQRQADIVAVGDLEGLEEDLVDAVGLEREGLREDRLAPPGIDRELQVHHAGDPDVMHLGEEAGAIPLRERGG